MIAQSNDARGAFAARQSMLERGDCSERVGCALAVQQHSLVEGTDPGKHRRKAQASNSPRFVVYNPEACSRQDLIQQENIRPRRKRERGSCVSRHKLAIFASLLWRPSDSEGWIVQSV